MKDFETKFEEWWEVVEEYFTKELGKNLVWHKANERIIRYKLETYQKKFQILFVATQQVQRYWAKMRRMKQGPMEQLKRTKCKQKNHMTLEKGVRKINNHIKFRNKDRWRLFQ